MRAAGAFDRLDVTENSLSSLGDERITNARRPPDAVAIHQLVVALYPQSFRAQDKLGDAHLANGDRAAAVAAWRRSLELNPRSNDAQQASAVAVERKIAGR
jgi:predicted TPR repeat methyltransferase